MNEAKKDKLKGGLADKMSKQDIADKFNVTLSKIERELKMGTDVEMEHVKSRKLAKEIAMDHLVEIPDYYTRLKKMEKEGKKKWNVNESTKSNIKRLFREQVELDITDETPDVSTYVIYHNSRPVGQLGIASVSEMDNAMEIVFIALNPRETFHSMNLIQETILALWDEFKDVHTILLTPMPESKTFWHKMGATRLNDDFLMLRRGH